MPYHKSISHQTEHDLFPAADASFDAESYTENLGACIRHPPKDAMRLLISHKRQLNNSDAISNLLSLRKRATSTGWQCLSSYMRAAVTAIFAALMPNAYRFELKNIYFISSTMMKEAILQQRAIAHGYFARMHVLTSPSGIHATAIHDSLTRQKAHYRAKIVKYEHVL